MPLAHIPRSPFRCRSRGGDEPLTGSMEPDDDCGVEVKAIEATKQHLLTGDPRPTFDRGARACF